MTAYVTSDLWTIATGQASFTWYDWIGDIIADAPAPTTTSFAVNGLNTTQVLHTNTNNLTFPLSNAILKLNMTATGSLPNTNTTTTFNHEFFFHPTPLNVADLVDPGLTLNYDNATGNFTVEATKGVAAWTWVENPAGTVGNFDSNGFWLVPGAPRELSFTMKNDTTAGAWIEDVTVRSIWNNTLS